MSMTGTLEEALCKLYDLYMDKRIEDKTVHHYLLLLKHENGEKVFGEEDAKKMVDTLRKDRNRELYLERLKEENEKRRDI